MSRIEGYSSAPQLSEVDNTPSSRSWTEADRTINPLPGIGDHGSSAGVALLMHGNVASPTRAFLAQLRTSAEAPNAPARTANGSETTAAMASRSQLLSDALTLERSILQGEEYKNLAPSDQRAVQKIIVDSHTRSPEQRVYYLDKLQQLLHTPYSGSSPNGGSTSLGERTEASVDAATSAEAERTSEWKGLEELLSGMGELKLRQGEGGTRYRVNGSNPDLVVVQLKVHVTGVPEFVDKTKSLEDAIEKAASARGYHVDLVFTDQSGPDVFEVQADPQKWANSRNWAGDPQTLAHELHHLLGLGDRYDYIESHATNADMPTSDRLYWFAEQMKRPLDPRASHSLMGDVWSGAMLSEDVCAVVGGNERACVIERRDLDPPGLPPLPPALVVH